MAMLKIPFPDDRGYLLFNPNQIANVEVGEDGEVFSLRLRGEPNRHVYRGILATHVRSAILSAQCGGKGHPLVELDRNHYTDNWCIFYRCSDDYVNSGKGDPASEEDENESEVG